MSAHRLVSEEAVNRAAELGHEISRSNTGPGRVICRHCHQVGDERSQHGIVFTQECLQAPTKG